MIRIINNEDHKLRNTTVGKVYDAIKQGRASVFVDDSGTSIAIGDVLEGKFFEFVNEDTGGFDWSTVADDAEAVVTHYNDEPSYYKMINGVLFVERWNDFSKSYFADFDALKEEFGDSFHIRPAKPVRTINQILKDAQADILWLHGVDGNVSLTVGG